MGLTIQSNKLCTRECRLGGDGGDNSKSKTKVYEMIVRPAMIYGLETVALTENQDAKLELVKLEIFIGSHHDSQD